MHNNSFKREAEASSGYLTETFAAPPSPPRFTYNKWVRIKTQGSIWSPSHSIKPSNSIKILYLINLFKHHSISFEDYTFIWNLEYSEYAQIQFFSV